MTYLLTAIGLCPVFASFTLVFALLLRKKHGKTSFGHLRLKDPGCLSSFRISILKDVHTSPDQALNIKYSVPMSLRFVWSWRDNTPPLFPSGPGPPPPRDFLDDTQRRTTVGRTPLDGRSACRRDLYLTTHNTYDRHPCLRWDSNP